jgi:RNA recognition motif-containing protein
LTIILGLSQNYETIKAAIKYQRLIMKLLVRNLSRTTTEQEIRVLFSAHGTVKECNLVLDQATGKSKGFAFVEMPNEDEAKTALSSLHEKRIAKNKIRVKVAQ